ncbi:MAG: hypothetical protein D6732_13450 [Methanobacteriota archaeon]|nr:MAG: hypothetical protein D6732_13450 [Euryarchaeota archaeon]
MIDMDYVTQQFSKAEITNDENGLIPAFGVYLTKIQGDYYAEISFEFEKMFGDLMQNDPEVIEAARQLLIEAGHVCGFNTFGGIMKSDEFEAVVVPLIEEREDWVRGMVAVINVLGWGVYKIIEVSEEKLIIEIKNSYEGDAYLRRYGTHAESPKCYLALGASIALMSLVFHADISQKPELDDILYDRLFKEARKYDGKETQCIAMGHEFCRIEISKL